MTSSKLMMNLSSKDWDLTRRKSSNSSSSSTSTNHNHPRSAITNVNNQSPLETTFTPQEIACSCKQEVSDEMMTLEDYLARAGAVEEDVKIQPLPLTNANANVNDVEGFGFGIGAEEMGGRLKRRAISETFDKAAQQRQRRMIKNRESAARSRERKQAYQAELESLALKLEQENETLLKLKKEQTGKRYKQLMNNIIPVTEKQRPTRYVLRKVGSMEW